MIKPTQPAESFTPTPSYDLIGPQQCPAQWLTGSELTGEVGAAAGEHAGEWEGAASPPYDESTRECDFSPMGSPVLGESDASEADTEAHDVHDDNSPTHLPRYYGYAYDSPRGMRIARARAGAYAAASHETVVGGAWL